MMHRGGVGDTSHLLRATVGTQVPRRQASSEVVLISDDTKHRVIDVCDVFPFR